MTPFVVERGAISARPSLGLRAVAQIGQAPSALWRRLRRMEPAPNVSPWGAIVETKRLAPGLLWFRTQARGGYFLSPRRQRALPHYLRAADCWYEDGAEWAAVAVVFPRIFERLPAHGGGSLYDLGVETLKNWRPDHYEAWFQTHLDAAEIWTLPVMQFHRAHADRLIVIDDPARCAAAERDGSGRVMARACLGGDPPYGAAAGRQRPRRRTFAVALAELHEGRGKPFLIDHGRHEEIAAAADSEGRFAGEDGSGLERLQ